MKSIDRRKYLSNFIEISEGEFIEGKEGQQLIFRVFLGVNLWILEKPELYDLHKYLLSYKGKYYEGLRPKGQSNFEIYGCLMYSINNK